jgi:multiple sugar transport system substrate-binding protein
MSRRGFLGLAGAALAVPALAACNVSGSSNQSGSSGGAPLGRSSGDATGFTANSWARRSSTNTTAGFGKATYQTIP